VSDALDYLRWAYEHAGPRPDLGVVAVRATARWRRSATCRLSELNTRYIDNEREPGEVYYRCSLVGVRPSFYSQGGKRDTRMVTHFAADVDYGTSGHASDSLPSDVETAVAIVDAALPPSCIIHSGGGVYAIWRLTEPAAVDDAIDRRALEWIGRRINKALVQAADGYHVDGLADNMAQIIRPPGTINRKRIGDARPVTLWRHHDDGAGDYTLEQLADVLPRTRRPARRRKDLTEAEPVDVAAMFDDDALHAWYRIKGEPSWECYNHEDRSGSGAAVKVSRDGRIAVVWSASLAGELGLDQGVAVPAARFAEALRTAAAEAA
jgi:hypothetical protein